VDIEKINKINIRCFSCPYVYNCKYYKNPLWNFYMFQNPNECPAEKYAFESIYYSAIEYNNKKKGIKWI
jgi:hypothetical protein